MPSAKSPPTYSGGAWYTSLVAPTSVNCCRTKGRATKGSASAKSTRRNVKRRRAEMFSATHGFVAGRGWGALGADGAQARAAFCYVEFIAQRLAGKTHVLQKAALTGIMNIPGGGYASPSCPSAAAACAPEIRFVSAPSRLTGSAAATPSLPRRSLPWRLTCWPAV